MRARTLTGLAVSALLVAGWQALPALAATAADSPPAPVPSGAAPASAVDAPPATVPAATPAAPVTAPAPFTG